MINTTRSPNNCNAQRRSPDIGYEYEIQHTYLVAAALATNSLLSILCNDTRTTFFRGWRLLPSKFRQRCFVARRRSHIASNIVAAYAQHPRVSCFSPRHRISSMRYTDFTVVSTSVLRSWPSQSTEELLFGVEHGGCFRVETWRQDREGWGRPQL